MRSIQELDAEGAKALRGVLFDLDDTLLDHGQLTSHAYAGLHEMRAAGLRLMAVTGRPAGWGEILTNMWPIDAMVTENGIITVCGRGRTVDVIDEVDAPTRAIRTRMRDELVTEIRQRFSYMQPAVDNHFRRADFTFDIGETRTVAAADVDRVERFARMRGARTVRSSVHLHVCYDGSDKASGAVRAIGREFGIDATLARSAFAFIGDSENDEPAFNAFAVTIGVANLHGRPTVAPRFRTEAERGRGFAELAARLTLLRRG